MPSNTTITNGGSGVLNAATGGAAQYNNNGSGRQWNYGSHGAGGHIPDAEAASTRASSHQQPSRREDFRIAIICALALEFDAVSLLFDQLWEEEGAVYGRAPGDLNTYTTGRIGKHNVALALLPNMGTAAAAGAAAGVRSSFPCLRLALIVGVCGGVPGTGGNEVLLGDVVISKTVQHSVGKQYRDAYVLKDTIDDSLGRMNRDLRTLVTSFETERGRKILQTKASEYLKMLQSGAAREGYSQDYRYPGVAKDKLFPPDYQHKHHPPQACAVCIGEPGGFCEEAVHASCADLRCDENQTVSRQSLEKKRRMTPDDMQRPRVHIGRIISGDTVMKSGEHRDRIAQQHKVIAFEMEGAGAWDEVPCIVVKGVCDYADSHKNQEWQPFAAATAASVAKAVLGRYVSD
ncbi:hypothetical protein ColLi_04964 [Colletotrichum liriopes]|uniref:Nucleoside phosphorylase domain-containing protein n=1 Tax=Colletotrichum liriopes TaxID=708192 RepID=A0AA37GJF4_9PEZI|nr:hypothetical protein ColLi_04964 [Colletotrichum liriopes]